MLKHQLRRALGVAIIRGNAKLKLSRLHYVRGTALEAAQVCEANHSERGWRPDGRGCPSRFASHVAEGYGRLPNSCMAGTMPCHEGSQ